MTDQPLALQLAEKLDRSVLQVCADAARELRRMHAESIEQARLLGMSGEREARHRTAMQLALEALDWRLSGLPAHSLEDRAFAALREALGGRIMNLPPLPEHPALFHQRTPMFSADHMRAYAKEAVMDEREAIAAEVEAMDVQHPKHIAAAIRGKHAAV